MAIIILAEKWEVAVDTATITEKKEAMGMVTITAMGTDMIMATGMGTATAMITETSKKRRKDETLTSMRLTCTCLAT